MSDRKRFQPKRVGPKLLAIRQRLALSQTEMNNGSDSKAIMGVFPSMK